ncbi:MAG: biopolymer transporter ExbD [Sedimentisphaerales bacterium]|nr:biopolymer transporter ExbD [Sedimentisphaerales bacterium]
MKLNLTGIIDIVLLLIIFLVIVYQRIDAENFQLDVPTDCTYAGNNKDEKSPATVSVFPDESNEKIIFAVGSEKCPFVQPSDIIDWLVLYINKETIEKNMTTLRLRVDKAIKFRDAGLVLAAAARSNATDLEISTIKQNITIK